MRFMIDAASILSCTVPSWRETQWAYSHGLIGWRTVVQIAEEYIARDSDSALEVVILAGVGRSEASEVGAMLQSIAEAELRPGSTEEDVKRKWLYLALNSLHAKRSEFPDPYESLSSIYDDFEYPREIAHFVPYMPSKHPQLSREAHILLLESNWKQYLDERRVEFCDR
jgi:hypothetical protein